MKALFYFVLLAIPCFAATDQAARLEVLKTAFPRHTTGEVNEKSDPLIIECFAKYRKAVDALTVDTLAVGVGKIRNDLEADIRRYESQNRDSGRSGSTAKNKVMTPSMRHALEKNLVWMKSILRPYVARLESFQRGRNQ
ncbi:MAG: hypothetical protein Q8N18_04945 [Opitutaceae bacterium]|nr:hypothetical protein [Opitutaceae bacterium]